MDGYPLFSVLVMSLSTTLFMNNVKGKLPHHKYTKRIFHLDRIKRLLSNRNNWSRSAHLANDEHLNETDPLSCKAVKWSLLGACSYTCGGKLTHDCYNVYLAFLLTQHIPLVEKYNWTKDIHNFNRKATHEELLSVIDDAISTVRKGSIEYNGTHHADAIS